MLRSHWRFHGLGFRFEAHLRWRSGVHYQTGKVTALLIRAGYRVYRKLIRQDTSNNRADLVAAVKCAAAIVARLNATLQTMTATGDTAVTLAHMQTVVAGASTQISGVQFDEAAN